jgi:hypothetical protein
MKKQPRPCIAALSLIGALILTPTVQGSPVVLDFDTDGAAGTIVRGAITDDEYASLGVKVNAINLSGGPNLAVAFDSSNPMEGDWDFWAPFLSNNPALSNDYWLGNILIIQENSSGCRDTSCTSPDDEGSRPAGNFEFEFEMPVNLISLDFLDIEAEEADPLYQISLSITGGGNNQRGRLNFRY